jgi:hypothetical protein
MIIPSENGDLFEAIPPQDVGLKLSPSGRRQFSQKNAIE